MGVRSRSGPSEAIREEGEGGEAPSGEVGQVRGTHKEILNLQEVEVEIFVTSACTTSRFTFTEETSDVTCAICRSAEETLPTKRSVLISFVVILTAGVTKLYLLASRHASTHMEAPAPPAHTNVRGHFSQGPWDIALF